MKLSTLFLVAASFCFSGCSSHSSDETGSGSTPDDTRSSYVSDDKATVSEYEGGSSSSNVHYSNPNTGTQSDYDLDVDYDGDGDVERINFNNGGWIDDTHITDQNHNGDGTITVTTDRGYEYTVDESSDSSDEAETSEVEEESSDDSDE